MKRVFKTLIWFLILLVVGGCSLPSQAARQTTATAGAASPMPVLAAPTTGITPQAGRPSQTTPPARQFNPAGAPDVSALPALAHLQPGWNQIDPGGATGCARGGKYSFFVRKATSDRLLIYFEGGGTCLSAESCRVEAGTFDDSIDPGFPADNPALKSTGLFALDDPRNPFRDDNIVFVSYCTGDGYMGHRTATYTYGGSTYQVHHTGFTNAQTALEWTYRNFPRPEKLFVVGCSAGVIGSYFQAPYILERYAGIPATFVGDSGGGYLSAPSSILDNFGARDLLPNWLPQYQQLFASEMIDPSLFFALPAQIYPQTHFALLDNQQDEAQSTLFASAFPRITLEAALRDNLKKIQAAAPEVRYYQGPGTYHCITMHPDYYSYQVNGVNLNDWFTRLAAGQPVDDVAP